MKRLFLTFVFVLAGCLVAKALAQEVHQGEVITLNSELSSNRSYEYTASGHIELLPGFKTEPSGNDSTSLRLDPFGVFPPEEGLTGGPNAADTGVVGSLGGTVDVGDMGAAVYTIPLDLPAGINGMQPNLAITYNSQSGNGLMGWGWDLEGISSVTRTGRTLYHDGEMTAADLSEKDGFLLDGKRLVKVGEHPIGDEFRTEHDEMSRIRSDTTLVLNGHNLYKVLGNFKVWKTDGIIMEYGATESSWIDPQEGSPQALCWLLNKVSDRDGNSILYHYYEDVQSGEFYIDSILYSVNEGQNTPAQFAVTFGYQGSRHDEERYYIGGNQILMQHLLKSVTVTSISDSKTLLRYEFHYDYQDNHKYNLLKSICKKVYGVDGTVETVNPTTITWNNSNPNSLLAYTLSNPNVFADKFPFTGDFNGDGYTDVALVPYKDSAAYHGTVDIMVYLNDRNRGFEHAPSMDLEDMPASLDWIHVLDINGDGLDDLVPVFYDSLSFPLTGRTIVMVYLNQPSSQSFSLIGSKLVLSQADIITGDFDGNGTSDVILLKKKKKEVHYNYLGQDSKDMPHIEDAFYLGFRDSQFQNIQLNNSSLDHLGPVFNPVAADYNGDGITEVLLVGINNNYSDYHGSNIGWFDLDDSQDCFKISQCLTSFSDPYQILYSNEPWCDVFPGDYNGDGKADLFYCLNGEWRISLSEGDRMGSSFRVFNSVLTAFPSFQHFINIFYPSLTLQTQQMLGNYSATLMTGDFDGDGSTDVCYTLATDSPLYISTGLRKADAISMSFRKLITTQNNIRFSSQFIHAGNFLGRSSLAIMDSTRVSGNSGEATLAIHALWAVSQYNSVTSVTDGLGNEVSFTYDWLMPKAAGTTDPFYTCTYAAPDTCGICPKPMKVMALRSVTVSGVNGSSETTRYRYHNAMYHRDGHGFLGFDTAMAETFRNSTSTPWRTRKVRWGETSTMGRYATMLPYLEASYINADGDARMVTRTRFSFENVVLANACTDLVTCPAMTEKTVETYSMDDDDELTSTEVTEYLYDYNGNNTYSTAYGCTSSSHTVTGYDNGISRCELLVAKSTQLQSFTSSWIVNRPLGESVTATRNNESVSSQTAYTYASSSTYRPRTVTVVPNDGSNPLDPLTLATQYDYDGFGNTVAVTVSAPHGNHGETPRTTSYEYGANHQHRLLTKETLGDPADGYTTLYGYGFHDRLDTVTDCNGKRTLNASNILGTDKITRLPDGTERKSRSMWAGHSPYAPPRAVYYTWSKSTGGATVMTFHHESGAVLRTVTFDFHGDPVFTDRRYDTEGLLEKESLPYMMGTAEEDVQWTTYRYDRHGRVERIDRPDGTSTSFTYNGLTTFTTTTPPPDSPDMTPRRTSKRLNALGWLVESVDEGGTSVFSEYCPDGSLKWTRIGSDESTKISMEYDHAGNRTRLHDPDYCTVQQDLVSVFNAFGQEVIRTTPRQLTSEFTYDFLGRTTSRVEQDVDANGTTVSKTTSWLYGETVPQKGLLLSVIHPEQTLTYAYDTCQRVASETVQFPNATSYTTQYTYDRASRTASVTYPSGFMVKQKYNSSGHPIVQTDVSGRELYRTVGTTPMGQTERFTLGGVLESTLEYDTVRHLLAGMKTKKGSTTVQSLLFTYDAFCNLATRKDVSHNMEETFTYDDMDRLTEVGLNGVHSQVMTYDGYGRMTSKTAGGQAVFSGAEYNLTSKPHALDKAVTASGLFPSTPQTVSYTGFDKVGKVKMGNDSLVYTYGYGHQRIAMEEHARNTVRTKRYVGACEHVTETAGIFSTNRWLTYLTGPTGVYAVVVTVSGTNTLHYILKDNLGSWTTITDSDGVVEQRLSYDAWGNLRDPNTWSGSFTGTPMFDRGFTGHEHLYNFGLINMNGRMYDPMMSSFLSVDQYVQSPENSQNFNRYAYCLNNPLRYVDPSGWRKQEPIPGRTPTSDDNYRDIYTYVERALEPRDLGILQLPTDDPSVVWMEENEMHGGGGGEPIIDPSKLTASQQKDFDYTVSYASENSSLFKKILDCLTNSKTTYSIIIGKTYNNVPAEFQQKTNALVFRDEGTLLSLLDMVEEMFHAYQSENIELYNTNEFNYEFEAKVARYFIMEQVIGLHETSIGTNFEIMHGFLSPNGIDVLFPTSQSIKSSNFLKCYYEGALYFREWNIINNYGNDNYKKMTLQTPKSLFELFKQ